MLMTRRDVEKKSAFLCYVCSSLPERNIMNVCRYPVILPVSLYVTLASDDVLVLTTHIQATKYRGYWGYINTWYRGRLPSSCYHFVQHCREGYSGKKEKLILKCHHMNTLDTTERIHTY